MSINLKRGEYNTFIKTSNYQYGVTGYISWGRLAETLKGCGEVREGEKIVGFNVDDRGISFVVEEE